MFKSFVQNTHKWQEANFIPEDAIHSKTIHTLH